MSKHKKEAEKLTDEVDGLQFQILEEKDKSAGLKMKIDGMIANHQSAIDDLKNQLEEQKTKEKQPDNPP